MEAKISHTNESRPYAGLLSRSLSVLEASNTAKVRAGSGDSVWMLKGDASRGLKFRCLSRIQSGRGLMLR